MATYYDPLLRKWVWDPQNPNTEIAGGDGTGVIAPNILESLRPIEPVEEPPSVPQNALAASRRPVVVGSVQQDGGGDDPWDSPYTGGGASVGSFGTEPVDISGSGVRTGLIAGMMAPVVGPVVGVGKLGVMANNVAAAKGVQEALGMPEDSYWDMFDPFSDVGLGSSTRSLGNVSIGDTSYGVSWGGVSPGGRATLTPQEAIDRSNNQYGPGEYGGAPFAGIDTGPGYGNDEPDNGGGFDGGYGGGFGDEGYGGSGFAGGAEDWHEGGLITDRDPSTYRENYDITAQEGEFVMPREAVSHFGVNRLRRMIERARDANSLRR